MFYADTSALVKLVVRQPETDALRRWVAEGDEVASSDLVRTELVRAVRRAAPTAMAQARDLLSRVTLLAATPDVFDSAARLDPTVLGSLDAIHLASALVLGDELEGMIVYDERLADAAGMLGIPVLAPV